MSTSSTRTQLTFFGILLAAVFILLLFIFWPFVIVLSLSAMMAVVLRPVYLRFRKFFGNGERSKSPAALLTLLVFLIVIIAPLVFIGNQIVHEAQGMYQSITEGGSVSLQQIAGKIQTVTQQYIPDANIDIQQYLAGFSSWIIDKLGGVFSGTVNLVVKTLLALIALYYFLRDGNSFRKHLVELSPLPDTEDTMITDSLRSSVKSLVYGSLVVALIQGIVAGIGFTIFGVPNATLWATTTAIASFVPGVGTALVWVPAVIYLFFAHASYAWVGQLIWGIFFVGAVDNFIAPKVLEKGINIHPLLILFSILGALSLFGPEGLLFGPLVLSLFFVLVKTLRAYSHGSTTVSNQ